MREANQISKAEAVYLKIGKQKNKRVVSQTQTINNKIKKTKKKQNLLSPLVINGIPTKEEFIDINLSCDYLYQYLYENKCLNTRYYNFLFFLSYFTLILIQLNLLIFLIFTMPPNIAYNFNCFDPMSQSYYTCKNRNWCACQDPNMCVVICYDSQVNCIQIFNEHFMNDPIKDTLTVSTFGTRLFVRYDTEGTNLNIFNGITTQQCQVENYSFMIVCAHFIGGIIGCFIFGLLSDRYGKKIILTIQALILNISFIFISIYSQKKFSDYDTITHILCVWIINGFILGGCLMSMQSILYIQIMENLPNVNNLDTLNGFYHSYFPFSVILVLVLSQNVKNYSYLYYFSTGYFTLFFFLNLFYFKENPRYFSERKENNNKKNSFTKFLKNVLIEKKKDGEEEEKYWKKIVFFDSTRQKIENDEIKDKIIEVEDEEIEFYLSSTRKRNKTNNQNLTGGVNDKKTEQSVTKRRINFNLPINSLANSNINIPPESINIGNSNRSNNNSYSINNSKRELNIKEDDRNNSATRNKINTLLNKKFNTDSNKITVKYLNGKIWEDDYLQKFFFVFLIGWMSISFCMHGMLFNFVMGMTNSNNTNAYPTTGVIIYMFIMCFITPILIGNISLYVSHTKLILICLVLFTIISITLDISVLYPEYERITYFGSPKRIEQLNLIHFNKATCLFLIIVVRSLFEMVTINSVPTLYRTFFSSVCMSASKVFGLMAYGTNLSDTPGLIFGIVSAFSLCIFLFIDIRLKDIKLLEYVNSEPEIKNKEKVKKDKPKQSHNRVGVSGPVEGGKTKTGSIFLRLRNLSIRKMKNN